MSGPATPAGWIAAVLGCAALAAFGWWLAYALRRRVWLWITRVPPRTGGERYCCEVAEELVARGYACEAMELRNWRRLRSLLHIGPVLESVLLAPVLAWCRGPFIVDENFAGAMLVTNWLRAIAGARDVVILVHHMDRYRSDASSRSAAFWQRLRLAPARRIVAVSEYTRREICSLGIAPERVSVVAPGCDPPALAASDRPAEPRSECRLLCVAPARPRKGLAVLLEALGILARADVRLTVVGTHETDHYREHLAPLIARHGLQSTVEFAGFVSRERLARLYAESDMLVCPSLQEGFSIVVAEALQSGLPVVASDAAALPELVKHGTNGLLFTAGDARALAAAIARLADDPALRASLASREGPRFSWPRCRGDFADAVAPVLPMPSRGRAQAHP